MPSNPPPVKILLELAKQRFQKSSGVPMDKATVEAYRKVLEAFDSDEWMKPWDLGVDFNYADSCYQFGLLEQRTTILFANGSQKGQSFWFRRIQGVV